MCTGNEQKSLNAGIQRSETAVGQQTKWKPRIDLLKECNDLLCVFDRHPNLQRYYIRPPPNPNLSRLQTILTFRDLKRNLKPILHFKDQAEAQRKQEEETRAKERAVQEKADEEKRRREQELAEKEEQRAKGTTVAATNLTPSGDETGGTGGDYFVVLYDFAKTKEDELDIHEGDVIKLIKRGTNWYSGEIIESTKASEQVGTKGWFPATYCEAVGADYTPPLQKGPKDKHINPQSAVEPALAVDTSADANTNAVAAPPAATGEANTVSTSSSRSESGKSKKVLDLIRYGNVNTRDELSLKPKHSFINPLPDL